MAEAPLPGDGWLERAGRFFYNLPGDARVTIVLLLALVGVPVGIWLHDEINRAPVGGACAHDKDCRSEQCLFSARRSKYDPLFIGLPPPSTGVGACTRTCKDDQECPSGFTCENGRRVNSLIGGKGVEIRVCVRREMSGAAGDL